MAATTHYDKTTEKELERILNAAMEHLAGKPAAYDAVSTMEALEALKLEGDAAMTPLALEAFVAVVIARGRRPRRAQKPLYRLFRARQASGELEAYVKFADKIAASADHGFSLEEVYIQKPLAGVDQGLLWKDTAAAIAVVEEVFGPAFLNSGTLLGAVRDGRFIEHDDDVDIAVFMPATNIHEATEQWFAGIAEMTKRGLVKGDEGRNKRNVGVFKIESTDGINIDVFPAWAEEGKLFVYPYATGQLSQDDLVPLVACEKTGLPIPRNAEALLEVNYGAGWRVPDPAFEFDWTKANKRFEAFREALEAGAGA